MKEALFSLLSFISFAIAVITWLIGDIPGTVLFASGGLWWILVGIYNKLTEKKKIE